MNVRNIESATNVMMARVFFLSFKENTQVTELQLVFFFLSFFFLHVYRIGVIFRVLSSSR